MPFGDWFFFLLTVRTSLVKPSTTVLKISVPADTTTGIEGTLPSNEILTRKGLARRASDPDGRASVPVERASDPAGMVLEPAKRH